MNSPTPVWITLINSLIRFLSRLSLIRAHIKPQWDSYLKIRKNSLIIDITPRTNYSNLQAVRRKNNCLAMLILCRDENDILPYTLDFHRSMGVDAFIIMDNGSVDGTKESLLKQTKHNDIILLEQKKFTIAQDIWINQMVSLSRKRLNARWVILSDADEIWFNQNGSIKRELMDHPATVFRCPVVNMLGTQNDINSNNYAFYNNTVRVTKPVYDLQFEHALLDPQYKEPDYPVLLGGNWGWKIICTTNGFQAATMGNHEVYHTKYNALNSLLTTVYHYPVRTFEKFKRKVINYGESLLNNTYHDKLISWHLRRWYKLYTQGRLRQEYEKLFLNETGIKTYSSEGIISIDTRIQDYFNQKSVSTLTHDKKD